MANVTYTVVKGDTLSGIAKAKGTTVNTLLALNPDITDKNKIYVGQVIIISGSAAPKTTNTSQKPKITNFGLQSDTTRTVFATWAWDKKNTDHYEVKWMYGTGDGVGFIGNKSDVTDKQSVYPAPENATHVAFYVRPISKTYKTKKNDNVKYWSADWSTVERYYFTENPGVPPRANASNITINDYKLTVKLNDLSSLNADSIQFQIVRDTGAIFKNGTAKISSGKVSYFCTLEAGSQYQVRSRSIKGSLKSDWSEYSDLIATLPAASDGIYLLYALSSTSVSLNWYDVSGVDSYEVQYTIDKRYFDSNPSGVTSVSDIKAGHAEIINLTTGREYFFRVRSIKNSKESAWSEIKSIALGTMPAAPTTWSSSTKAKVGESLTLYWVHNSQDGSRQTKTQLEIIAGTKTTTVTMYYGNCVSTDNLTTKVVTLPSFEADQLVDGTVVKAYMTYANTGSNIKLNVGGTGAITVAAGESGSFYWDAGSMVTFTYQDASWVITDVATSGSTEQYSVDTSQYTEGVSIQWKVRTSGILKDVDTNKYIYSEWSTQRTIDIYAPPTVAINVTNQNGEIVEELTAFPFNILANAGPNTQTPIGYFVSITNVEAYEDIDEAGNTKIVSANSEIYYKKIDETSHVLSVPITASDVNLANNITYKVTVIVSMNSGLTGESSEEFTVSLADVEYWPDAEIIYDSDSFTTSIRPYCENEGGALIEGISLAVYRREFDGSFTELASGLDNTERTYVTDPHPALDYARYRIVASDLSSGAISYYDVPGYPIGESSVIIQWDEHWQNFDLTDDKSYEVGGVTYVDELDQPSWSGSLIKLPYNIDVSDDNQVDVSHVKYIGRKHPVAYYGTQLGSTSIWTVEIPKEDKQTLYALRRLAVWTGDVYVREPSGSGYWASIAVSFSQTHKELTIPITISITRVEGGK